MPDNSEVQKPSSPFIVDGNGRPLADADRVEIRKLIEEHGAVLLRGFSIDTEAFADLGDDLCSSSMFNESPNRETFDEGSFIQSVDLGGDPFPLHPELSREPWRPDLAMFVCFEPPEIGGQTNICDGIAIAENLPADLRSQLDGKQLFYIRGASPDALELWLGDRNPDDAKLANPPSECPYWFRRAQGQVLRGFTRPALEPTLFQQEPAFSNFILFARDYLKNPRIPLLDGKLIPDDWVDTIRSVARKLTYSHKWQQGDVILLDNSRFMHGRKAIVDAGERRIATYFGYLKGIRTRPGEPADPIWRRERFSPPDIVAEN